MAFIYMRECAAVIAAANCSTLPANTCLHKKYVEYIILSYDWELRWLLCVNIVSISARFCMCSVSCEQPSFYNRITNVERRGAVYMYIAYRVGHITDDSTSSKRNIWCLPGCDVLYWIWSQKVERWVLSQQKVSRNIKIPIFKILKKKSYTDFCEHCLLT